MIPAPCISDRRLSLTLVGVRFIWRETKARFGPNFSRDDGLMFGGMRQVVGQHIARQKRKHIEYWDAFTYLERASLPPSIAKLPECELACDLIHALGTKRPFDRKVQAMLELPFWFHADCRLAYHRGAEDHLSHQAAGRTDDQYLIMDAQGRRVPRDPGFFRDLTVWMDGDNGLGIDASSFDFHYLLVLAVLVQLRADLETYYETGLMRARRCERFACGGWFAGKRMAARQKFCTTYCRVAHSQEKSSSTSSGA